MLSVTKHRPDITIVIPAYNEEDRLGDVLKRYKEFYNSYEIIVVCNGCTDSTPKIAKENAVEDIRVKTLIFKERLGKGGAILEGFKEARGEFLGFLDADESVEPEEYLKLIDTLKTHGFDGAIGSRRAEGAVIISDRSFSRRIASKIFNILVRGITGLKFFDTQCGAKIFKKKTLGAVIDRMNSLGYEFDVELLLRLKRLGYKIAEVPVKWKHSGSSKFSLMHAPAMFVGLLLMSVRR
ncbi:MAG: dolichyl-phosphate beta-glucosyltransferase [Candidatus Hydrothermarchaeales archaeon]